MQTLQKLLREGRLRFSTLSTDFSTINGEYSPRAVENPRLSPFQHFSHNTKWIIHNPQTRTAIAFCGLFHRIHGPYYYYYPRFLSLQSKIKPAPPRALPSRENFLPSLPIKTDKKLSTPAKQVVRVGIWPSNHGRNARTGPYFRAARAAGTRKKLPRTGKFPVSKGQTEQKSILSCLDFYCRKRSL